MITLQEALHTIHQIEIERITEHVGLSTALYRVLAQDIVAKVDLPGFDKSAMDGYACKLEDIEHELEIIEHIPAGTFPTKEIKVKQCSSIMTGAPIPIGANCVVMKEHVTLLNANLIRVNKQKGKQNICFKGEDVKQGEVVISKGTLLLPAHIATAASVGYAMLPVYAPLKVAVAATGSEIIEPGLTLQPSQIYNSNAYQLIAQLKRLGLEPVYIGIVEDDEMLLTNTLRKSAQLFDVIILTGGVSVGDHDLLPNLLQTEGYQLLFNAVAMKPGKPVCFARKGHHFVCGLSGNPVSSFLQFEFIATALLKHLSGSTFEQVGQHMQAGSDFKFKTIDRTQFIPVGVNTDGTIAPVEFHGSAHLHALTFAKAIAVVEPNTSAINKGDTVYVRFI